MDDLDVGDLGAFDPASMAFDIPEPTAADAAAFEGVQAAAMSSQPLSLLEAPGADIGSFSLSTDVGTSPAFSGDMAEDAIGMSLGGIPEVTPEVPDLAGAAYSDDGGGYESPAAFSVAPVAPPSDAPMSQDAMGASLGMLPPLEPPMDAPSPFAGVSLAPEEAFDLQMALAPPPPSQEGFSAASDAPTASPVGAWAMSPGSYASADQLRVLDNLSSQAFGPLGEGGAPGSRSSSSQVTIHNLHLPAAKAFDALSEVMAMSTGTEFDLSGLGA